MTNAQACKSLKIAAHEACNTHALRGLLAHLWAPRVSINQEVVIGGVGEHACRCLEHFPVRRREAVRDYLPEDGYIRVIDVPSDCVGVGGLP